MIRSSRFYHLNPHPEIFPVVVVPDWGVEHFTPLFVISTKGALRPRGEILPLTGYSPKQ
jgi:hypothetical protein